jgi:hypothetical protein
MKILKGIKFEVEIMCENELSDEEAKQWIEDAMDKFCEFDAWRVDIKEAFDAVICMEESATA